MRELTDRQREVLGFMRSFQMKHGVPPTVRELGERFRITPRAAFDHLRALERKGELQRRPSAGRTSRALTLPDAGGAERGHHPVPILGRIAAGAPLLAQENREGELPIAAASLPGRGEDIFALRVRGDSMIEAGIFDGDYIVVRQQATADPGETVVAGIPGEEATVKTFSRRRGKIVLKPANEAMDELVYDPDDVLIYGKVVTVLRTV